MSSPVEQARQNRAVSPQKAREQVAEFHGFAASVNIQIGDEIFEIPNPSLLDDDQQERFNALQAEINKVCDREDDIEIPEHTTEDGTVFPAKTIKGDLKQPFTVDGDPLTPAYNTRLAIALFGEERYRKFKAGGGRSNQIALIWGQMNQQYEERLATDAKSRAGVDASAPVSNGSGVGPVPLPPPVNTGVASGDDVESGTAG